MDEGNYSITISQRSTPGQAELHETETDTFYIVNGSATFVTSGKVQEPKTTRPGQVRGNSIEGWQTHQLKAGDAISIPARRIRKGCRWKDYLVRRKSNPLIENEQGRKCVRI